MNYYDCDECGDGYAGVYYGMPDGTILCCECYDEQRETASTEGAANGEG